MKPSAAIALLLCSSLALAEPYDTAPFTQGLSKAYRSNPARKMGVSRLSDLPLYQIDMELKAVLGTFEASQEIVFCNPWKEDLCDLILRIYPNAPHLTRKDERNLEITELTVDGHKTSWTDVNPTTIRVPLKKPCPPAGRVLVGIKYRAVVPRLGPGAARLGGSVQDVLQQLQGRENPQGYGVYARGEGIFNLGFFYPIIPARTDRGWDTESPVGMGDVANFDVANYLVKLRVPKNMVVASSGVALGEKPLGSGPADQKEVYLLGTALRDFALQCSTRYAVRERKVGGVRVRYFHVAEDAGRADTILTYAADSLRIFQSLFGPYPYPKLDVAQAPLAGGAGGMEYPGLITVALAITAESSGGDPLAGLMAAFMKSTNSVEFVLAHEVAHQWWHALVGSDSNRHPFLDEALANYAAVLYFEKRHGRKAAQQQLQLELSMPYQLYRAMGGPDGRVDRPVKEFSSQLEYAALVYGKGALFFNALRRTFSKGALLRLFKTYAARFAFRQARPGDLLRVAESVFGKKRRVRELYRRWILENHGDEDIGTVDFSDLDRLVNQLSGLQQTGNLQLGGPIDPAILRLFQQAVRQLSGP
jgi:hypothetical protein